MEPEFWAGRGKGWEPLRPWDSGRNQARSNLKLLSLTQNATIVIQRSKFAAVNLRIKPPEFIHCVAIMSAENTQLSAAGEWHNGSICCAHACNTPSFFA